MLNVIFVSDDLDAKIGPNCALSHGYFTGKVDLSNDNVVLLNQHRCTAAEVEQSITSFDGGKFILVAYSHGCEEALISNVEKTGYVHAGNSYFFGSSLIYTNCCHSGVKLKQFLIDAGCFGYVGYEDEVRLPRNINDQMLFIECENSGLINLLSSDDSLTDSIVVMKNKYSDQYNIYINDQAFMAAALLQHNMNCLTYYDNGALNRAALEN